MILSRGHKLYDAGVRQLLYISDSLVGTDISALDRIMVQARAHNSLFGLTGLLWTDGKRFAHVLEGERRAVGELLAKLSLDGRHARLKVVQDTLLESRQYGDWSMMRPSNDRLFAAYESRMITQLNRLRSDLGAAF